MIRTNVLRRSLAVVSIAGASVAAVATPLTAHADAPPLSSLLIQNYTVSPSFSSDGTIYAYAQQRNCSGSPCDVIFKSTDRGVTWNALPSAPSNGLWQVVLPSAYPTDSAIFAPGNASMTGFTSLNRSNDGGQSWTQSGTGISGLTAAARPGQSAGHDQIVIEDNRGFNTYDEASDTTTAGPTVPNGEQPYNPAFVDADTFFTAAITPVQEAEGFTFGLAAPLAARSEVLRCTLMACTDLGTLPNWDDWVAVSPGYATDHTLFAWGGGLDVSTDGGSTFHTVGLPFSVIYGVTFTSDTATGPRLVVTGDTTTGSGSQPSATAVVDFSGSSYTVTTTDTSSYGWIRAVTSTPDGHVWGTPVLGNGTLCSADLGSTWAASC